MTFNENEIISSTVAELTKAFFADLKNNSVGFISRKYTYLFENFEFYLNSTYNKCNNIRTIINKDRSFEISDIYVPGTFKFDDVVYSDFDVIQNVRDSNPIVILGFGGIGKTVFMKHLWLSIFKEPKGKIPVYLELRKLSSITDLKMDVYVRLTVSPPGKEIDANVFADFMEDGRFVFIFDGFDEVSDAKKDALSEEIIGLSYRYPKNGYVLSSRHDDRFASWQMYKVFRACPFSKEQVLDVVERIPYGRITKKKFVSDIINKKYDAYDTFLSTPLLTLMMLMTFAQFAEVPDKRHIFYRYAFMTLYSWHDSSKEAFNREKQSGLVLDQFEQAFSVFCLISYLNNEVEFGEAELRKNLGDVKKYVQFEYDVDVLIVEITDTVNLMYKEADKFLFTHRSFQEYFAAYSVVNYFQHKIVEIVPRVFRGGDSVLPLMYEINRSVVEEYYIIPTFKQHDSEISLISTSAGIEDLVSNLCFYVVGGFYPDSKGRNLSLHIFGSDVRCKSWVFVCHLRSFFDLEESSDAMFDISVSDFETIGKKVAKVEDGQQLVVAYDPARMVAHYVITKQRNIKSFEDDVTRAIEQGQSSRVRRKKLADSGCQQALELQRLYRKIEVLVRAAIDAQAIKVKSIDELLA